MNLLKQVAKQIYDLRWQEVSGVDHSANEEEGWAVIKCRTIAVPSEEEPNMSEQDEQEFQKWVAKVDGLMKGMSQEEADEFLQMLADLAGKVDKAEAGRRSLAKSVKRIVNIGAALDASRMVDMLQKALGNEDVGRTPENQHKDNYHEMLTGVIERLKAFKEWLRSTDPKNPKAGEFVQPMIVEFEALRQESEAALSISKATGLSDDAEPLGQDPEIVSMRNVVKTAIANAQSRPPDAPKADTKSVVDHMKDTLDALSGEEEAPNLSKRQLVGLEPIARRGRIAKGS